MSERIEIDHLRTWIGRGIRESETVTPELLRRLKATLSGYTELGAQIPLGIHWCLAQPVVRTDNLGKDGHPTKGDFLPPVPLPRRMWASSQVRFHKQPRVGATITKASTIADVVLKQSAVFGPLVFVYIDHIYTQEIAQGNQILIEERQTIVYRQPPKFKPPEPRKQSPDSARSMTVTPSSPLLFRYSAITFNAHRIHYDLSYATREEGYPGLVVHGPLMATLLMNFAQTSQPHIPLRELEFRIVAPAFVDQPLQLIIHDDSARSLEIWNHEGALIMVAKAQFGSNDAELFC